MAASITAVPVPALVICEHNGEPFYEAKFRHEGRQVKRRVGPAWLDRDRDGGWHPRRGRVPEGFFDDRRANVRAAELAIAYIMTFENATQAEQERITSGPTFRKVAHGYLDWLERIKDAKPATLRQHRRDLAEPGVSYRRGTGETNARIMAALGDLPARQIELEQIEELLDRVAATGVSPRFRIPRANEVSRLTARAPLAMRMRVPAQRVISRTGRARRARVRLASCPLVRRDAERAPEAQRSS